MLPMTTGLKADPLSHTRLPPGARRSFFCRMKCKTIQKNPHHEADTTTGARKKRKNPSSEKKYVVVHCVGYIKSWTSHASDQSSSGSSMRGYNSKHHTTSREEDQELDDEESCNLSCLVALGRTLPPFTPPAADAAQSDTREDNTCQDNGNMKSDMKQEPNPGVIPVAQAEFVGRLAMDGKFLFVDQRAVFILGYLPQELNGTSIYEYCHPEDVRALADSHRKSLATSEEVISKIYRIKAKNRSYLHIQTKWKSFINPWTKELEFLVAKNFVVVPPEKETSVDSSELKMSDETSSGDHHKSVSGVDLLLSCMSGQSGTNGSGDNSPSSEARIQKILSSSRVNLWKIGQQIAEEASILQRQSSSKSNDSTSNITDPMSFSPQSQCSTSPLQMSSSDGVSMTQSQKLATLSSDNSPSLNGQNGNGSGSDSGGSGSNYSNTFYTQPNPHHQSSKHHNNHHRRHHNSDQSSPSSAASLTGSAGDSGNGSQSISSGEGSSFMSQAMTRNMDPLIGYSGASTSSNSCQLDTSGVSSSVQDLNINDEEKGTTIDRMTSQKGVPNENGTNDETAMALIMSILEADAGLGGPVDFSSLPWPLL